MSATSESGTGAARPSPVARAIGWALERRVVRAFLRYSEQRGPTLADSITYRTLFSVFAGVLLGFSVLGLWLSANDEAWQAIVDAIDRAIPGLVGENGIISTDAISEPAGFTLAGIVSLVGLVGAALGAIGSLRAALLTLAGRLHDETAWYLAYLRNLAVAVAFGALLAASAAVTFVGATSIETVAGWLGHPELSSVLTRIVSILVVLALDTVAVALVYAALSPVKAAARDLWTGALLGGVGLIVLQELSGLFVGGARANPLLATFASLIALLLWFNLSAQVILLASSYILTAAEERTDRVCSRYGARTFAQRRVQRARDAVEIATAELRSAEDAAADERGEPAADTGGKPGGR